MRSNPAPFDHVISLGTVCYPAWVIKNAGQKKASYPFDWIFATPAMVLDILRDDFVKFLDPTFHVATSPEERPTPHDHVAGHNYYHDRFGVKFVFSHRDVTQPEHLAYYRRGVDRFRALLDTEDRKRLVMVCPGDRLASAAEFSALAREIDDRSRNAEVLVINLGRVPNFDASLIETKEIASTGRHRFLEYRSCSGLRGLGFAKPIDDRNLKRLILD